MKDNQNRNLEATKKWAAIERQNHEAGMLRVEANIAAMVFPEWVEVEGIPVLRIDNSEFVAVPMTGRKSARKFDIINLDTREFVCQVTKDNINDWLIKAATI